MKASTFSLILISALFLSWDSLLVLAVESKGSSADLGSTSSPSPDGVSSTEGIFSELVGSESSFSQIVQRLSSSLKEAYDRLQGGEASHGPEQEGSADGEQRSKEEKERSEHELLAESLRWEVKARWREETGGQPVVLKSKVEEEDEDEETEADEDEVELSAEAYRREKRRHENRLAAMYSGHHFKESMERSSKGEGEQRRRKLVEGDGEAEEVLGGDFYYNKNVFKRSYNDMEKNLKVFVYSEGSAPLTHYGTITDSYSMDGLFMHYLKPELTRFVTTDAEEANVFFIPVNFVSLVTYLWEPPKKHSSSVNVKPMKAYLGAYTDMIARTYPYFWRNGARDHFILSCHDWTPLMSRGHRTVHTHVMRVMCNANVSRDFASARDIPLPAINIPRGEYPTEFGGPPPSGRTFQLFYAGSEDGKIRRRIFDTCRGSGFRIFRNFTGTVDGLSYKDYLQNSKYCLCPGGVQVNTARIVEAIYNGCVPVIASDGLVLPFSDVLDWPKFSVIVYYDQIPKLDQILAGIPRSKYVEMQARLAKVRKHFIINTPPQRYDVFHMVLHSLWLRHLQRNGQAGPLYAS